MKSKQKYYVVWRGRETGVFDTWEACKAQIDGFKGAQYKSFPTQTAASEAFAGNYLEYAGKNKPTISQLMLNDSEAKPVVDSIAVDAACSGNPGVMEYRGVLTATGQEIFHFGPIPNATNNIGEFLAIVHALALIDQGILRTSLIYSDSLTGQAWVRQKKCKSKLALTDDNVAIFDLIRRAELWLATHHYSTPIVKWPTELWGEIPADFGRK